MGLMPGSRGHKAANGVSTRWVSVFCIASFCFGVLVINRFFSLLRLPGSHLVKLLVGRIELADYLVMGLEKMAIEIVNKSFGTTHRKLMEEICLEINDVISGNTFPAMGPFPCLWIGPSIIQTWNNENTFSAMALWVIPDPVKIDEASSMKKNQLGELQPIVNCDKKDTSVQAGDILSQVSQTHDVIMTLDKTISSLEMQLAAARASKGDGEEGSPMVTKPGTEQVKERQKVFFVMGIMTAFSSRKRRTQSEKPGCLKELKKLEKEKGIIIRFVIGHSATPGGVLDRTIDAEETQHKDFLRLNHIEGYHELSSKTQIYFSTAVARWDADFYIKVDDDVHINLGMVGSTLARHRSKPRVYTGCMKSGPVLSQTGVKYHEPEYWKFGNLKLFIVDGFSSPATYCIDDRSFCCGSPPGKLLPDNVATCL
ncbi:Beta-1,6-galactosyltransferase GALT31A [Vitis vinifera]|uniref:Hexosyltransferase n=1 Tax=Vitis vinifera TaxID=29760 RepID=A0A438I4L0_VITVI|nr:Beta-1,6-galactosyltransferase GALT31A [Vitis vinifera]